MKKLLQGMALFRRDERDQYRANFGHLATGQSPDALLLACSDSRVVPNIFASTDPGDMFVMRNVGNMIPAYAGPEGGTNDDAEAAALEFAIHSLGVAHIIICGHSECGAVNAVRNGRRHLPECYQHLKNWLRHGEDAKAFAAEVTYDGDEPLSDLNRLSLGNVIAQCHHLAAFPAVKERLAAGNLEIHGWWFDIKQVDVYAWQRPQAHFSKLTEESLCQRAAAIPERP